MFPKIVKKKTYNLKTRKTALDKVFSEYIRIRDANSDGVCKCITCGKTGNWKYDMDCGHFVSRNKLSVRWDEKNANAQCHACNRFRCGEQFQHGKAIDIKHGAGTADRLIMFGKISFKIDALWIEDRISDFKNRIKKIKIIKNC